MSGAGCVNLEHDCRIVMHADASRTPLAMSWKSHGSTVKVRCRIYGVGYIMSSHEDLIETLWSKHNSVGQLLHLGDSLLGATTILTTHDP